MGHTNGLFCLMVGLPNRESWIPDRGRRMETTYSHDIYNTLINGRYIVTSGPKRLYHLIIAYLF